MFPKNNHYCSLLLNIDKRNPLALAPDADQILFFNFIYLVYK